MATQEKDFLLGFDPGGRTKQRFGWCILEDENAPPLKIFGAGSLGSAGEVLNEIDKRLPKGANVLSAGIDAPLSWAFSGPRSADTEIRSKMGQHPDTSVQEVNSLRGACVAQGIMIAVLLRKTHKDLGITEAHPKAFLEMMGIRMDSTIESESLKKYFRDYTKIEGSNEIDVRDAAIAGYFAWVMAHSENNHFDGWTNLFSDSESMNPGSYFLPIEGPLSYWFPAKSQPKQ